MYRRLLFISATIAIGFLFKHRTSETVTLQWRRLLYKSTNIRGPYEAPIRCEGPEEDLIPDIYMVYLHFGCSLEQHKSVVGEGADLDSAITHVFPEDEGLGLCYEAKLNDTALVAVRSDLVVDMVECEYEAHLAAIGSVEEL